MKQVVQRAIKKAPKVKDAAPFDASWCTKSGKFDNAADYVFSFKERSGWFRGAKIQRKF